jgi:hypothetical protein
MGMKRQEGIVGTNVDISLRIVAKRLLTKDWGSFVKIGQRDIGSHMLIFHCHNSVDGAIGSITRDLARPEFPAEARAKDADPRMGWFSITSDGVTNAAKMMRDLPPSTT